MRQITSKSVVVVGLFLATSLLASAALGQTLVTDALHMKVSNFAWVEQQRQMYADEIRQIEQIRNQIQQIQKQAEQIQNQARMLQEKRVTGLKLKSNMVPREINLQKRDDTAFLQERCGALAGSAGLGIFDTSLGDMFGLGEGPQRVNEARQRQHASCTELVVMENKRHNFVVDTIKTIQEQDEQIASLIEESADIPPDEHGRIDHNSNQIQGLQAEQARNMELARRQLQYFEQQISTLKDEMAWAGQAAFSNRRANLLGKAVQYGTMKAALGVARRRDR